MKHEIECSDTINVQSAVFVREWEVDFPDHKFKFLLLDMGYNLDSISDDYILTLVDSKDVLMSFKNIKHQSLQTCFMCELKRLLRSFNSDSYLTQEQFVNLSNEQRLAFKLMPLIKEKLSISK